jgi:hypothetical protein
MIFVRQYSLPTEASKLVPTSTGSRLITSRQIAPIATSREAACWASVVAALRKDITTKVAKTIENQFIFLMIISFP